jgi:methylated-DNA-protein-cysteine methyltransferase-like protein
MISPRGPGSTERQAAALRREGVRVGRNAMGEFSVEFGTYGWFPELLPSEEGDSEEDSGDEGYEGEQGQGGTEVKEEVVEVKEEEEG